MCDQVVSLTVQQNICPRYICTLYTRIHVNLGCIQAPACRAAAASAGVSPHLLHKEGSAECARKTSATSLWPLYSAMCKAVQPSFVRVVSTWQAPESSSMLIKHDRPATA